MALLSVYREENMPISYNQVYIHLIWGTWDRLPLISPLIEPRLYAALAEKCREHKCVPLAIGGIENHVHLLVKQYSTISVADLVKELKGSSSHLITHEIIPGEFFKWQGSYGAISVNPDDISVVEAYILHQKQHHRENSLRIQWERVEEGEPA
jgi:REP element-mobilizing transposase RayT